MSDGASGTPRRATINDDIAPDEMTPQKARELLEQAADDGRVLGQDPATGRDIVAKAGRYGPYVTEAPRGRSRDRGRGQGQEQGQAADGQPVQGHGPRDHRPRRQPSSCSACLASSGRRPRRTAPTVEITAQNGRYGPYLKKGTDSRSLTTEEQLFDITLEEALAIYAQPKQRGRAATAPLKELGNDPVSGRPMVVKDGRFGPYVTDGETNSTLRKGDEPESITPERGAELLAEKRAKGPTTRKRAAKKTAKKSTTKKAATKKRTAKKA